MNARRWRAKPGFWLAIAVVSLPVLYVLAVRWPAGGARAAFGFFSGTWTPSEAKGMTEADRQSATAARAETIRAAVLAYSAETGGLPATVDALVPRHLPAVPSPLTSTRPFQLRPSKTGFTIKWEAWPNALYECYWIDEKGEMFADM